jgi:hypothetical protein
MATLEARLAAAKEKFLQLQAEKEEQARKGLEKAREEAKKSGLFDNIGRWANTVDLEENNKVVVNGQVEARLAVELEKETKRRIAAEEEAKKERAMYAAMREKRMGKQAPSFTRAAPVATAPSAFVKHAPQAPAVEARAAAKFQDQGEKEAQAKYIRDLRTRYGGLSQAEKDKLKGTMCHNQCRGKDCWAWDDVPKANKVCPFSHQGEASWDEKKCKEKNLKMRAGGGTRKNRR